MPTPQPIPNSGNSGQTITHAGVSYNIAGELVPVLSVNLTPSQPVYFEHHVLLTKDPAVTIGLKRLSGAFKRAIAGLPILMTEAKGDGHISFSRDGAGQVLAMHLQPGQSLDVREHQFLAATKDVQYSFQRVKGVTSMLFGGSGFFIDTFTCDKSAPGGILWLHGYGNLFDVRLKAGESIDVEPGAWLFKESLVQMTTQVQNISTGFMASSNIVMNRFSGPGRVGIQSMYMHTPEDAPRP